MKKAKSIHPKGKWFRFSGTSIMFSLIFMVYPVIYSIYISTHNYKGLDSTFIGLGNFARLMKDTIFWQALLHNFLFLLIQVPIMLILGLLFANLLNSKEIRFKGFFRLALFLPCVTSLVAYSLVFKMLFQIDGLVNHFLMAVHLIASPINWLNNSFWAKVSIIIALCWRWTGYNMMFYISGMQNIPYTTIEAARIDGATRLQEFFYVVIPQLKEVILFTSITSTIGTIQLFDEVVNITAGGPSNATMTASQYIYNHSFVYSANFGYSAALSWVVVLIVAALSMLQFAVTREKKGKVG